MPRFKVQAGKVPFKNPFGGESSWIEVEADNLEDCLMKTRIKHPDVPVASVFLLVQTKPGTPSRYKAGELLFTTFEEIPE